VKNRAGNRLNFWQKNLLFRARRSGTGGITALLINRYKTLVRISVAAGGVVAARRCIFVPAKKRLWQKRPFKRLAAFGRNGVGCGPYGFEGAENAG